MPQSVDLLCERAHTSSPTISILHLYDGAAHFVYEQLQTCRSRRAAGVGQTPAQAVGIHGGARCLRRLWRSPLFPGCKFPRLFAGERRTKGFLCCSRAAQGPTFNVALKHSWRGEGGYRSLGMTRSDLITEDAVPCFQQTDLSSCAAEKNRKQKNPHTVKEFKTRSGCIQQRNAEFNKFKGPTVARVDLFVLHRRYTCRSKNLLYLR